MEQDLADALSLPGYLADAGSQALASLLLNASLDSALLLDTEGRILLANPIAAERFGLSLPAMRGRHFFDLHPPELARTRRQRFLQAIESKLPVTFADEREGMHFEARMTPMLDGSGQVRAVAFFGHEVSGRKKLEKVRENVERTARHDMKSALVGIVGLAGALLKRQDLQDRERSFLEVIKENGEHLLHMLYASLDLLKMQQGVYQLSGKAFDLSPVLEAIALNLAGQARERGVELVVRVEGAPLGQAACPSFGEADHLESCLSNLIKNAVEAAPAGSAVTVAVTCDPLTVDIHNLGVIPEAIRQTFFEPFVTQGKPDGTGLGTYSARLIARAHGGDISFATDEAKGTHVVLRLPGHKKSGEGA